MIRLLFLLLPLLTDRAASTELLEYVCTFATAGTGVLTTLAVFQILRWFPSRRWHTGRVDR